MEIPRELVQRLPKTDLHVHLDGSLRPETLLELASQQGVALPFSTPTEVIAYMRQSATVDLKNYLSAFDHTLVVLQTPEALRRVAFELAEDAARENVRYMEVRFAPPLHERNGMAWERAVQAVLDGLRDGEDRYVLRTGVILTGIRTMTPDMSQRLAELTVAFKHNGVVGFDLAGEEAHYPAKDHREAFYIARNNNVSGTVHAGEGFGAPSIHQALHWCGAHRIGHGTLLWQDRELMNYVNDHRIPLEMCLTSNVQTGASSDMLSHPFRIYFNAGIRVTINTDNRLISDTSVTNELDLACRTFQLSIYDLRGLLINGFKSAFLPYKDKVTLLRGAIDEMDRLFEEYFPGTYRRLRSFL
jgi:adenosine deaminase